MPNLTETQLGSVRSLIQAASDTAIRDLESTLSTGVESHEGMRLIQRMVGAEADDRRARNAVFGPLTPMCMSRGPGVGRQTFPPAVLTQVWRGLKAEAPGEIDQLAVVIANLKGDPLPIARLDALCLKAADGLRERRNAGYAAAAAVLDAVSPEAAIAFAAHLDLVPMARGAVERLPDWLGRQTEERVAAARVAFRDATAVSEDAGPRLLEILYAHLEEPWTVLRLISAVMHRPADRYVATSELASFGERLLDDIDRQIAFVTSLDVDGGAEAGAAAGQAVRIAAQEIAEFDEAVDLSKEGPWGGRLTRQKRSLVAAIEGRLKQVESEVAGALPLQSGANRRATRGHPRLSSDPDQRQAERARAFLAFMACCRPSAEKLGYGGLWTKVDEALNARIDMYVEDLLEKLRAADEKDNLERVRLYLDLAADFLGVLANDKAAQIVRRRIAAAA